MVLVTGSGLPDQQNIRGRMDDSEWNSHRKVGGKICHWQGCIQVLKKVVLNIIIVKCCTFLIDVLGYFCLTYDTISNYSAIIGRNMSLFKVHLFKFIYAMPAVSQVYRYRYICIIWCIYMYWYMFCYSIMYSTCLSALKGWVCIGHHALYILEPWIFIYLCSVWQFYASRVTLFWYFYNFSITDLHYKQLFEGMYFLLLIHCLSAIYHNERPPNWL